MTAKYNPHILEFTKRRLRLENAIVGGCLLEQGIFEQVNKILIVEDFRQPIVKDTWLAMHVLKEKEYSIDLISVIEYFHFQSPKPYKAYDILEQLVNRVCDTGNVVRWAFMMVELTFRAKAIHKLKIIKKHYPVIVEEMLEELMHFDTDIFDLIDGIKKYSDGVGGLLCDSVTDIYKEMQGRIEEIKYQNPNLRISNEL